MEAPKTITLDQISITVSVIPAAQKKRIKDKQSEHRKKSKNQKSQSKESSIRMSKVTADPIQMQSEHSYFTITNSQIEMFTQAVEKPAKIRDRGDSRSKTRQNVSSPKQLAPLPPKVRSGVVSKNPSALPNLIRHQTEPVDNEMYSEAIVSYMQTTSQTDTIKKK